MLQQMQNCMKSAQLKFCFLRFDHDFGGPEPPRGLLAPSWKMVQEKTSEDNVPPPCCGSYFCLVLVPNVISLHLFLLFVMLVFGFAFGHRFQGILDSVGSWGSIFINFVGRAAKLQQRSKP